MLRPTHAEQCEWQVGVSHIPVRVPGAGFLQWGQVGPELAMCVYSPEG